MDQSLVDWLWVHIAHCRKHCLSWFTHPELHEQLPNRLNIQFIKVQQQLVLILISIEKITCNFIPCKPCTKKTSQEGKSSQIAQWPASMTTATNLAEENALGLVENHWKVEFVQIHLRFNINHRNACLNSVVGQITHRLLLVCLLARLLPGFDGVCVINSAWAGDH